MKALKIILALMLVVVSLTSALLVSATNSATINLTSKGIDPLTDKVTVSGTVSNGIENSILTMLVLKPNADDTNIKLSDIVYQDQTSLSAISSFAFTPFSMLVDADSGTYKIIVTGQRTRNINEVKATFNYTGKKEIYEGLVAIENADANSIGSKINQYGEYLLIDKNAYNVLSPESIIMVNDKLVNLQLSMNTCSDFASNLQSLALLSQKAIDFRVFYNNVIVIGQFVDKNTAVGTADWMNTYTNKIEFGQASYDMDYDFNGQQNAAAQDTIKNELNNRKYIYDTYGNMTQTQKNIVLDVLSNKNDLQSVSGIREAFYEQILLKAIELQTWTQTRSIIQTIPERFNLDYSDFNLLNDSNKDKVYQNISGVAYSSLASSNGVKQAFENSAKGLLNSQNAIKNQTPGNSGGSSEGSVSFTPSVIKNDNIENKDDKGNQPIVAPKTNFKDISGVQWAAEAIGVLNSKGIINGKSEDVFAPNDAITRAEFIKILIGTFKLIDEKAKADFKDVQEDKWYYKFIAGAQKRGIATGRADGTFGIDEVISRQDMVVLLSRVAKVVGVILPQAEQKANFNDSNTIDSYAKQAVKEFSDAGIVSGMDENRFAPLETATRAQAAKIIYGILKLVK